MSALHEIETAVSQYRLHAAGFITYEAAAAFDLAVHPSSEGLPLLWFGLYQTPEPLSRLPSPGEGGYHLGAWQPSLAPATYHAAIDRIKAHIAAGYTYQVNYTFHLRASFYGDPWALFAELVPSQQAETMAYVDTGRHVICSVSPELFFTLDGERLLSRPMKGTAVRGLTLVQDRANMAWLHRDEKNRAENVMIVDMIRNDMGRVARIGSVQVPHLFAVERYPTVLQMTSTVIAETAAPLTEIMASMFPCASITGAPKVRTMQLIKELEPEPRGVYTGAVGHIAPGRQIQFNVAIRTVVVDIERGEADYGVGSGIVWDSDAAAEYEECRVKARVLTEKRPYFRLLESLLWTPEEGYSLLAAHLHRLAASAEYFDFAFEWGEIQQRLVEYGRHLTVASKIRLLVDRQGATEIEAEPLGQSLSPGPICVRLAAEPVDTGLVWLYHKTTHRQVYDDALDACPDCDDVILWNERGEITESCRANVVVVQDGRFYTPPVASGLLAGTLRGALLAQGDVEERLVTRDELLAADEVWLINSVRGWQRVRLLSE